jgi:hypothetical protein
VKHPRDHSIRKRHTAFDGTLDATLMRYGSAKAATTERQSAMWILTPLGFFSIVQKPNDSAAGTLTVRARVRSDLESLKASVLPGLGAITESKSTDYRFRATAPRALVETALAKLVTQLDYSNFKTQVSTAQGAKRANLYHDVWSVLQRMQGDPSYKASGKKTGKA